MRAFASHASHCSRCADPYRTHLEGGTLCDRGHALAHDITQYIYSKAGLPFSVTDRERTGDRVQIEVPPGYDAVRSLLKAMDRGLRIRGKNEARGPVARAATAERHYYVPERTAPRMERRPEATIVEMRPSTGSRRDDRRERRETRYVEGRGSRYRQDELERQQRSRSELDPVIIIAAPRGDRVRYSR